MAHPLKASGPCGIMVLVPFMVLEGFVIPIRWITGVHLIHLWGLVTAGQWDLLLIRDGIILEGSTTSRMVHTIAVKVLTHTAHSTDH